MGEGSTPAPVSQAQLNEATNPAQRSQMARFSGPAAFGNWMDFLMERGVSQNVGSFVGAGSIRVYGKGLAMGEATGAALDSMRTAMRYAMEQGAFGLASALIYPPNTYATQRELTEVAKAMAPYGGVYITHMRSEADQFLEAVDEAIAIGKDAGVPVEIYHLKASGPRNWPKMPRAIAKIDSAPLVRMFRRTCTCTSPAATASPRASIRSSPKGESCSRICGTRRCDRR
jgi:dihydroorotase/N-acyl-D-amino-acid deacylase